MRSSGCGSSSRGESQRTADEDVEMPLGGLDEVVPAVELLILDGREVRLRAVELVKGRVVLDHFDVLAVPVVDVDNWMLDGDSVTLHVQLFELGNVVVAVLVEFDETTPAKCPLQNGQKILLRFLFGHDYPPQSGLCT